MAKEEENRTFVLGVSADDFKLKVELVDNKLAIDYLNGDTAINLDVPIDADKLSNIVARAMKDLPEIITILSLMLSKER